MPKYPEIFLPLGMVILLPLIRTIIDSLFRVPLQALSCNEKIMDFGAWTCSYLWDLSHLLLPVPLTCGTFSKNLNFLSLGFYI